MARKVTFWLAPNETFIPADQVPGAIADVLYPLSQRECRDGVPHDPKAVERLKVEREHSKKLKEKYPKMPIDYKFRIDDLNDYLADLNFVAEIQYRIAGVAKIEQEEPTTVSISEATKPPLFTKQEILAIDWPMPHGAPALKKILDDLPKWVSEACVRVGKPGGGASGSHLWKPAVLAHCLATKTPHKRWICSPATLTNFLRHSFPDNLAQWESFAEDL